jgi:dihydroxyacetone kinase-like protein
MGLTTKVLMEALGSIVPEIEAAADELNALDARVGDGDLGITLTSCARRVSEVASELPEDVGLALMKIAEAIMKVSGASFATLLAGGLMGAAKMARGRAEISWEETSDLLGAAAQAMLLRGKSKLGDKTIVDAVDATREATKGLSHPVAIVEAAQKAVDEVMEHLRNQPIKAGRARIWGEKSIGLDDPGTVAFRRILDGLSPKKESHAEDSRIQ